MINKEQLHSYSLALAEKITTEYFSKKSEITGKEIISLTAIEQLNFFILKTLFGRWKDEEDKLRSPYFNYEDKAVKEALANLLIQLSNNISIKREFFRPLLSKAIYDTLFYALEPSEYLQEYFSSRKTVSPNDIRKEAKYFKINTDFFHDILTRVEQSGKNDLSGKETAQIIKEASGTVSAQDAEKTLNGFSKLLKIEIEDVAIKPKVESSSPVISMKLPEKSVEETPPQPTTEVPQEAPTPKQTDTSEKPAEETVAKQTEPEQKATEEPATLNDLFKKREENSLAETFRKNKLRQFRSYITLNQRFLFAGSLFGNDQDAFNKSIDIIEAADSYADAKDMLYGTFAEKYNWKEEPEELQEFLKLIQLRFEV
ncbi:hypothetical protein RCC89_00685 [Cytophagaceae bacterium ABcell3]|nr:hypothetical protein RCC89_00685 [Cytophagaceae bacterium ABcell3]